MRTIAFKTLRDGIMVDIAEGTVTDAVRLAQVTAGINLALDLAYPWLAHGWPELTRVSSETITSQVINLDALGTGYFGTTRVLRVTRNHPHTSDQPRPLEYQITAAGIIVRGDDLPATAYVEHIDAPPVFDNTAWVTNTSYAVGDVRLQGNDGYYCRTAHTSGTFATDLAADKWAVLKVPAFLNIPIRTAVAASLRGGAGQDQSRVGLIQLMERQLEQVALRYENTSLNTY